MSEFRRRATTSFIAAAGLLGLAAPARAQFGELQRFFFRGSDFLSNPNYVNTPQQGPLFDNNLFDQRLQWNRLGGGYTFEEFRFFGPDSFDNGNTIDLGALKVSLGRDPAVTPSPQPVGIHNKIGYTTTIIPELTFASQTGQRNFDIFSGQTAFVPVPLHYDVKLNTGAQDFQWAGNAFINSTGRINILGFYDYQLQMTNVGSQTSEGYLVKDEQVTDFDTGPINVSGNIFFDAIASLFQPLGPPADANGVPFRIYSGAAQKDKRTDELLAKLKAGEPVSDDDMQYLVQQMFIAAFRNDPIGVIQNGLPTVVPGFELLTLSTTSQNPLDPAAIQASNNLNGVVTNADGTSGTGPATSTVPEPSTLMLLATLLGSFGLMRSFTRCTA